jgi:sec-independent protein translocase protein TatA
MNLGWMEISLILVVVILLFGARKLPELGKGLGSGIRNFKSAMRDGERGQLEEGRESESVKQVSDRTTAR